ncbi:C40 family peptidase [Pseudonocardia sp. GCM10023141]|uniref:C40 family peptidase n=1 Tax=Pseudonocardia sp. GCM10023141 TaxID=3252653 RepID=UPI00361B18DA
MIASSALWPGSADPPGPAVPVPAVPNAVIDHRASVAVTTALAQLGLPYEWGGNGPAAGDAGFDCSGLTRFAYAATGIRLPRTAFGQFYAGPVVASGAPLLPGDLVFYGVAADVHHVGLYLGDGKMVNATMTGQPIKVSYYRWPGDDYFGATRPTAAPDAADVAAAPPAPKPAPQGYPARIFEAPSAPLPDGLPDVTAPQPPEAESAAAALAAQGVTAATR